MENLSMLEHALALAGRFPIEDLGEVLHISRLEFEQRESFLFRARVPVMEYLSLMIETALLLRTNRTGRVYVGFERLSRMEGVADRFMRIADLSERVYVFGEPDWKPPRHPNLRIIKLAPDSPLTREWFIIAESSTLRVALIGQDEDGFDAPVLEARKFRALKSSSPLVVSSLTLAAEGLIDSALAA